MALNLRLSPDGASLQNQYNSESIDFIRKTSENEVF